MTALSEGKKKYWLLARPCWAFAMLAETWNWMPGPGIALVLEMLPDDHSVVPLVVNPPPEELFHLVVAPLEAEPVESHISWSRKVFVKVGRPLWSTSERVLPPWSRAT